MAKMKAVQVPKAGADFERLPLSVSPKISSRIFGLEPSHRSNSGERKIGYRASFPNSSKLSPCESGLSQPHRVFGRTAKAG